MGGVVGVLGVRVCPAAKQTASGAPQAAWQWGVALVEETVGEGGWRVGVGGSSYMWGLEMGWREALVLRRG